MSGLERDAAESEAAPVVAPGLSGAALAETPLVERALLLQRTVGNRATRRQIARLVTNPFLDPAAINSTAATKVALDAYKALSASDKREAVKGALGKLSIILSNLSSADKLGTYAETIREITRAVQEEETRATAGMTDEQIAAEQMSFIKQKAEAAAKAAAAAKGKKSAPSAAEVETERQKQVESTSIPPSTAATWNALSGPEKAAWVARAGTAITKVINYATSKFPELGIKGSHFRIAFEDVEARGAGVAAFGEDDGAGGTRAAIGFDFVTAVELDPAYMMDVVVHEVFGHPGYGEYGTEYHLALYDLAMKKMPGYKKPAEGTQARTTELDAYAYQETEIYSVLRSMPYRTAPKPADAGKVANLDTMTLVSWHVALMKDQWSPKLVVAILRGLRRRLMTDPRITGAAIATFDVAVRNNFDAPTLTAVQK